MNEPKPVALRIVNQGAVLVNSACIWREADDIVCIYVDLSSKRAEVVCTGSSPIYPPSVYLGANEETLHLDEEKPRDAIAIIEFPDYIGWRVFATSGPVRYTLGVVLVRDTDVEDDA